MCIRDSHHAVVVVDVTVGEAVDDDLIDHLVAPIASVHDRGGWKVVAVVAVTAGKRQGSEPERGSNRQSLRHGSLVRVWNLARSRLLGQEPVSYTHLDVYKRQAQSSVYGVACGNHRR